ncbi:DNA topoisomerase II [Clostridium botulinum A2B3 87]|uniref:desulfoferrodoxin n=1 Tax=Clostridium botulinum TaxID=1491 RepID=UPI0004A579C1|nr:desulfoferrodoxin [Clostridium botulinum]KEI96741.1 DNA topoisomerase II [Clostridium botulinum A2B3 87]
MVKLNEVYKCDVCGNIVQVVHASAGQLVCCGKPMRLLEENTTDAALEKHVPVVEKIENGVKVKVGEKKHPMEEKHYIEWIEVITENKVYKKYLKPGEKPEAEFKLDEEVVKVREYCNIHGLWKK